MPAFRPARFIEPPTKQILPAMALSDNVGDGLNKWLDKMKSDVASQRTALKMRTDPHDTVSREQMQPYLEKAVQAIDHLESQSVQVRQFVIRERKQRERLARIQKRAQQQAARVALIRERLPDHISAAVDTILANSAAAAAAAAAASVTSVPVAQPEHRPSPPPPNAHLEPESVSQRQEPPSRRAAPRPRTPTPPVEESSRGEFPIVDHVTERQLKQAPQYVKGRLTVDKIAKVVEKLNAFLKTKYTVYRKHRRDLKSDAERDMMQMFQESECPETEGKSFVTDMELKKLSDFKMDATARSVINVLRHVGALKEVRGKNKARIFIVRE